MFFTKTLNKRIQIKKAYVRTIFKPNKENKKLNLLKANLNYTVFLDKI